MGKDRNGGVLDTGTGQLGQCDVIVTAPTCAYTSQYLAQFRKFSCRIDVSGRDRMVQLTQSPDLLQPITHVLRDHGNHLRRNFCFVLGVGTHGSDMHAWTQVVFQQ